MQNPRHPKYSIHIGPVSGGVTDAGNDISVLLTANVYSYRFQAIRSSSLKTFAWVARYLGSILTAEVRHVIEEAISTAESTVVRP